MSQIVSLFRARFSSQFPDVHAPEPVKKPTQKNYYEKKNYNLRMTPFAGEQSMKAKSKVKTLPFSAIT